MRYVRYLLLLLFTFSVAFCIGLVTSRNESSLALPLAQICGKTQIMVDECIRDMPPHLIKFLQNAKIVISRKEIMEKCNVFNRGMKCFDAHATLCLDQSKLEELNNNVKAARTFFYKFCNDIEFQRVYLRHKDCFAYIEKDWLNCTAKFETILINELHNDTRNASEKFMEFCCARYAYENCIHKSARSPEFARETAQMLSDQKHFKNCAILEDICGNASRFVWHWLGFQLTLLLVWFVVKLWP